MKSINSHLIRHKYLASSKGQSLVEYIFILNGIALVVLIIIITFGKTLKNLYQFIVNAL